MTQERIELRLSPANPEERELIAAVEAQGEEYGAKGRFLKARMVKGYYVIMKEVDRINAEPDPMAALDHIAQSVSAGHYRVLKALLQERQKNKPLVTFAVGSAAQLPPATSESEAIAEGADVALDTSVAELHEAIQEESVETGGGNAQETVEVPAESPPVKPPMNWGAFRGIAGKKGN